MWLTRCVAFALPALFCASLAHADAQTYCADYGADIAAMRLTGRSILTGAGTPEITEEQRSTAAAAATADCLARFAPEVKARTTVKAAAAAPDKADVLQIGSEAWKAYCAKKYTSFDAATGTYTALSGKHRPCVVSKN